MYVVDYRKVLYRPSYEHIFQCYERQYLIEPKKVKKACDPLVRIQVKTKSFEFIILFADNRSTSCALFN